MPDATHDPFVRGRKLIQRVRESYNVVECGRERRPRFLHEYVIDFLSQMVNDAEPYSKLPLVSHLPLRIRDIGNRFLARQIVSTGPHPQARSFSSPAELRHRNLKGRVLAVLPYPIFYPEHGGQFRAHDIYMNLSKDFEIIALSLGPGSDTQLTSNLRNVCVPMPERMASEQKLLEKRIGLIAGRVVLINGFWSSEGLLRTFDEFSESADVVIFSHPYLFPLEERLAKDKLVVYDCVDVEYDLFKSLVLEQRETKYSKVVMKIASKSERDACEKSDRIFVTCKEQAIRLGEIYRISTRKMHVVPNPIDKAQSSLLGSSARRKRKAELGLGSQSVILYLASWHPPHVKSLEFILSKLAPKHADWTFLILGTIADEFARSHLSTRFPKNIIAYGKPTPHEKAEIYKAVDVAIDPVSYGSGTEIKILVYMAAGLPIVSTKVGIRGLKVRDGQHVIVAEPENFGACISRVLGDETLRNRIRTNALSFVAKYQAPEIADTVSKILVSALQQTRKGRAARSREGTNEIANAVSAIVRSEPRALNPLESKRS